MLESVPFGGVMSLNEFLDAVERAKNNSNAFYEIASHAGSILDEMTISQLGDMVEALKPIAAKHQNVYIKMRAEMLMRVIISYKAKREKMLTERAKRKEERTFETKQPAC